MTQRFKAGIGAPAGYAAISVGGAGYDDNAGSDPVGMYAVADAATTLFVAVVITKGGATRVGGDLYFDDGAGGVGESLTQAGVTTSDGNQTEVEIWYGATPHSAGESVYVYAPNTGSAALILAVFPMSGSSPLLDEVAAGTGSTTDPEVSIVASNLDGVVVAVIGSSSATFAVDFTVTAPGVQLLARDGGASGGGLQYVSAPVPATVAAGWTSEATNEWAIALAAFSPTGAETAHSAVLEFYPPENDVPSSATVTLYKPNGEVLQAATSATVDTTSTTLSAAADAGDRLVALASASGLAAPRRLLVTGNDGWLATIDVSNVDGLTAYLARRLAVGLDSASPVLGFRLSYPMTETHTADVGNNYRAHWSYVVDGVRVSHDQLFDIVAEADWYPTALADVLDEYHELGDIMPEDQLDGVRPLANAWNKHLVPMLRAQKLDPAKIKDKGRLVPVHCALVNWVLQKGRAQVDAASRGMEADRAWADVELQWARLLADPGWYDDDSDQIVDDDETTVTRTGIRLSR